MGKGRIISAQGEGRYTLEILEDRTRAEAARTTAQQRIAEINSRIADFESELSGAQSAVDAAVSDQNQAIADYQASLDDPQIDTEAARKALTDASEVLVQAAADRDVIKRQIAAEKAERLSLETRIDRINALPPLRQIDAWCADYVEDLSGEVATAEVPGEIGQVIIQPGFTDGAAWSPTDDGAIQPALAGTPASVFYNLAMMPGWQKWRPTFRIATISNIDNDLCDISLDTATSSQQGLNVNAQDSYTGVPIMYMDCNGDAFEDGDRVLVAFSGNTEQPMVVGFEMGPVPCESTFYMISGEPMGESGYSFGVSSYLASWFCEGYNNPPHGYGLHTEAISGTREPDEVWSQLNVGPAYSHSILDYNLSGVWEDPGSIAEANYDLVMSHNNSLGGGGNSSTVYVSSSCNSTLKTTGTITIGPKEYDFSRDSDISASAYAEKEVSCNYTGITTLDLEYTGRTYDDNFSFDGFSISIKDIADEIGEPNITWVNKFSDLGSLPYSSLQDMYPEFLIEEVGRRTIVTLAIFSRSATNAGHFLISIEKVGDDTSVSWNRVMTPTEHVSVFRARSPRYQILSSWSNITRVTAGL